MQNMYGNPNFIWWFGVVEDRNDPEKLGRCRVRIVGYHPEDVTILPTRDLPWALAMTPITSASTSGIGITPIGPVEGTWVVGWFLDGDEKQQPIMMGTITGSPDPNTNEGTNASNPNFDPTGPLNSSILSQQQGFIDPNRLYPKKEYDGKPDTNKLAVTDKTHAYFSVKSKNRKTGVKKASSNSTWSEPTPAYNARYPSNQVIETEAGHVVEFDNTPNAERIHVYHKKGTYIEIDINGTMVKKVVGDNYEVCDRNGYVYVKGAYNLTVGGATKILVENNADIEVNGALNVTSHGSTLVQSAKTVQVIAEDIIVSGKSSLQLTSDGPVNIQGSSIAINAKDGTFSAKSSGDLALQSGSASTASFKGGLLAQIDATSITTHGGSISVAGTKLPVYPTPTEVTVYSANADAGDLIRPDAPGSIFLGDSLEPDADALAKERITAGEIDSNVELPQGESSTSTKNIAPKAVDTAEFKKYSKFPHSLQLSKYYTLGDLTTKPTATSFELQAQEGLSEADIVGNLKHLAVNMLDPIFENYSDVVITSGFRVGTGSSHNKGSAADLQFPGHSFSEYYSIAKWIADNLPYKQILLEYATRPSGTISWIHIASAQDGSKSAMPYGTMYNHSTSSPGAKNLFVKLL